MDLKFLIIGGIIIFSALVIFIILFIFLYQKRYYRHLQEKENLRAQFSNEILQAQLEIQEQTLKNIAQEIHDNIGQELSLAKINLNTIDLNKPFDLPAKINTSKSLVSKAIQDLRDLSRTLNTDSIIAMGLSSAIEYEMELIRKSEVCNATLHADGNIPRLDEKRELILFRIVQESLHNIIKHAYAANITVTLKYSDSTMSLTITDDGRGFDSLEKMAARDSKTGMGLRNMQNRAKLINADLRLNSTPNSGTEISLLLPVTNLSQA